MDRDTLLRTAERLIRQGKLEEAIAQYVRLLEDQPHDAAAIDALGDLYTRAGDLDGARQILTAAMASEDPDLLLTLARIQIRAGRHAEGFAALTRCIAVAPDREQQLMDLSAELAAQGLLDAAYGCAEIVVDAALLAADWPRAMGVLRPFTSDPPHRPALQRMLEIAREADMPEWRHEAEARLAAPAPKVVPLPPGDGAAGPGPDAPAGPLPASREPETADIPDLSALDLFDTTDWSDAGLSATADPVAPESALTLDTVSLAAALETTDVEEQAQALEVDLSDALDDRPVERPRRPPSGSHTP